MNHSIVLTTCPNLEEAKKLSKDIISNKLASCIQIKQIESIYFWENSVNEDIEYQLIIKTNKSVYKTLENFIKQNHSYKVPQIIQVDISNGSKEYLEWLDTNINIKS